MKLKFYLDKPNQKTETTVYLFLRFKNSSLKFNTGKRILPKYWNQNSPENHFRKMMGCQELNYWLNELRTEVTKKYYSQKEWTVEDLRTEVLGIINKGEPKDSKATFDRALLAFIDSRTGSNELAPTTIKKYKTLKTHLLSFSARSGIVLRFEKVNKAFYEHFSSYLRNELGHTTNTVNKYLKTFKTFINWAVDHQYTTAESVTTKYAIKDSPSDVIYLTMEQLLALFYLDLERGTTLAKVRDVFCFGCFTGQRFSDIANLKRSDIVGEAWILHQIKVKDTVATEVPLNEFALEILQKYANDAKPLPVISNQKTNQYLKVLCQKAGLEEPRKVVRYKGNEKIEISEPLHNLIGTHTARRTFITLSLEQGMRPEMVMAITGHNDFKTMKRYIAITNKVKGTEMRAVWNAKKVNLSSNLAS